jgi:MoaA/NifB/PqqE/SkfB family radical SAM enzyme
MSNYINNDNVVCVKNALENQEVCGKFLPTVYVIEPTSRCNIQCVMCPNKYISNNNLGDMPLPLFEQITQTIGPFAEFVMLYWLGEPLIHSKISEMLAIARKNIKGKLIVSTNLTKVSDEILNSLLDNTDIILCSLDRWDEVAYERIRKGAKFYPVVSNIERLLDFKKKHHTTEIVVKGLDISIDSEEYEGFRKFWCGFR